MFRAQYLRDYNTNNKLNKQIYAMPINRGKTFLPCFDRQDWYLNPRLRMLISLERMKLRVSNLIRSTQHNTLQAWELKRGSLHELNSLEQAFWGTLEMFKNARRIAKIEFVIYIKRSQVLSACFHPQEWVT